MNFIFTSIALTGFHSADALRFGRRQDGDFVRPPPFDARGIDDWENNPRWSVGSTETIQWEWTNKWETFSILISQVLPDLTSPFAIDIYNGSGKENNCDCFEWLVNSSGFDLDSSRVFVLGMFRDGSSTDATEKPDFVSHPFNITPFDWEKWAPSSTVSVEPTASTIASTTATRTSFRDQIPDGPGLDKADIIVIVVGLVLGVPVLGLAIAMAVMCVKEMRYRRKRRAQRATPSSADDTTTDKPGPADAHHGASELENVPVSAIPPGHPPQELDAGAVR